MKQEVKDFLSKAEIKLVEPYLTKDQNGCEFLVVAEDSAIENNTETILCIDNDSRTRWITKGLLTTIQPKSRSIEDGLVEGDIITNEYGDRKVLMANQYCVVISSDNTYKVATGILTYSELIEMGYTLKQ